jgi:competence protein ComEA
MERIFGILFALLLSLFSLNTVAADAIDINSATADQIVAAGLKGIGKAKAQAIVQDREKNGPFKSIDDLTRVKGIKSATVAKLRDKISVGGTAPPASAAPAKPEVPAATAPSPGTTPPKK